MKKDKKSLVAYAAGLIDGEGCITCSWTGNRLLTRLAINMTTHEWVDLIVGLFGGNVMLYLPRSNGTVTGTRPAYIWTLGNMNQMHYVLKLVLPFLRVKKDQAQLAIRLIERKIVGQRKQFKERVIGVKGNQKLSDHEQSRRKELSDKLSSLKYGSLKIPKCIDISEHQRILAAVENKYFDGDRTKKSSTLKLCSGPTE